jgi:hypothetical protein
MKRTASVDSSVLRVADSECGRQSAELHSAWHRGEVNVWSAVSSSRQQNLSNCGLGYEPGVPSVRVQGYLSWVFLEIPVSVLFKYSLF